MFLWLFFPRTLTTFADTLVFQFRPNDFKFWKMIQLAVHFITRAAFDELIEKWLRCIILIRLPSVLYSALSIKNVCSSR